jgi:hypothetical protein
MANVLDEAVGKRVIVISAPTAYRLASFAEIHPTREDAPDAAARCSFGCG